MYIAHNTEFIKQKIPLMIVKIIYKKFTLFYLNLHKITHFMQIIAYNY